MNARTILTNIISFVSYKMHKRRRNALMACICSLMDGSAAAVTSIGRGIRGKTFEIIGVRAVLNESFINHRVKALK